ncbi:MAG: hypothetical protein IJZ62_02050, partial [Clostridia bacterium]|nr:hypothetical protein [Clostridia bacterium]
ATSQNDTGEYEIAFKACDDGNYNISVASGTLTITPRDISIALSSQTLSYGESYALNNEAFTVSEGTIVGQDKLGLTLYTK